MWLSLSTDLCGIWDGIGWNTVSYIGPAWSIVWFKKISVVVDPAESNLVISASVSRSHLHVSIIVSVIFCYIYGDTVATQCIPEVDSSLHLVASDQLPVPACRLIRWPLPALFKMANDLSRCSRRWTFLTVSVLPVICWKALQALNRINGRECPICIFIINIIYIILLCSILQRREHSLTNMPFSVLSIFRLLNPLTAK